VQRAYYKLEERTHLFSVVEGPTVTEKTSWTLSFYFGPKELNALAAVDTRLEKTLDYSGMFSFLAKLLLYLLNWLYLYVHNYGLAIILLTLLIQICLLPVSLRNGEEKFKKQQAEYQRELAMIEQRFAGNQEKLLAERTALIRRKGLPGWGCLLPILLQLPIFFALSRVLSSSFELYQAPMLWISDLSQRDPYYILPALIIVSGLIMQDMKGDPQQRMSKIMMAFVFGAFSSTFAAGLALYFLMSRVFGFIQTKLMHFFRLV
jgi:YidC/Oxa1 family membrane protein insertase